MDNDTIAESIASAAEYAASANRIADADARARVIDTDGHAGHASDGHASEPGAGRGANKLAGAPPAYRVADAHGKSAAEADRDAERNADSKPGTIADDDANDDANDDGDGDAYGWRDR